MNAQLALNHIIKTLFFAGCRINFNDDIVVVAHDCIATNIDRKHVSK
jgi:hypothetical protein